MNEQPQRRIMNNISERDFGRLEAEVKTLQDQNIEFRASHQRMNDKLDLLVTAVTEAKGGWKMLMAVGSASAVLGALTSKLYLIVKGII